MITVTTAALLMMSGAAQAGNTSSNSSSNSSNGVHTRVDTIIRDDGRGRSVYEERRVYRERASRGQPRLRRWRDDDDD
jgi:hypothetical protein